MDIPVSHTKKIRRLSHESAEHINSGMNSDNDNNDTEFLSLPPIDIMKDPASCSNFTNLPASSSSSSSEEEPGALMRHMDLNMDIDFENHILSGIQTVYFLREANTLCLKLDVFHLDILSITSIDVMDNEMKSKEESIGYLDFEIKTFQDFGSELCIKLLSKEKLDLYHDSNSNNDNNDSKKRKKDTGVFLDGIQIKYKTKPDAPGLCWLEPEQTFGKEKKFLFTQGQAILNRSFFPCMDTPAVRITFTASVNVPVGYTALMGAKMLDNGITKTDNNNVSTTTFSFEMVQSIPAYLVALCIGDLVKAELSPRTAVWTEPKMLESCKNEFIGVTEQYLSTGEKLFGKYCWDNYDMVVMPPSFPFGGMENPRLTFLTPCLIVGDKSLTDTVAHEISHSWFGNLVTNASWSDFWLNEGFTMYAQRRITSIISGKAFTALEATTGAKLLEKEIENLGVDHELTRLRVPLADGVDPEDTYNDVPYEKGYAFVCYLRSLVESDEIFDSWLKAYVATFKFQSIMSECTLNHFLNYFPKLREANVHKKPGLEFIDTWLMKPGYPPFKPDHSIASTLTEPADVLADTWMSGTVQGKTSFELDIKSWSTYQKCYFLDKCIEKKFTGDEKQILYDMGKRYGFLSSSNAEIVFRWCEFVIKNDMDTCFHQVKEFLETQGKQKYTVPTYRSLMKGSDAAKSLAVKTFERTKFTLHINVRQYVEKILK